MPKPTNDVPPKTERADPRKPVHRKLTDPFVKKVQPGPLPTAYHDTVQKGFLLMVRPGGGKSYKLLYRAGGRPRWYHIGPANGIGLKEARAEARRLYAMVVLGTDPQAERKAVRATGTFGEMHARYLDEWAMPRHKSWRQADALVRKHLLPRWANLQVASISRADVMAIFNTITRRAPKLANQVIAAGGAVFTWAIKHGGYELDSHPFRNIERNDTVDRERVLDEAEIPAFWEAFGDADPVRGPALRMVLLTGQRPGEVSHMRWADIKGNWWSMPGQPEGGWPGTKNKESHRVWLTDEALAVLAQMEPAGGEFVFPSARGLAVRRLPAAMTDICAKLGAPRATPHDLRRTFGTTVTTLGFTREQMDRVLNHIKEAKKGSGKVYDRYHYAPEMKRIQEAFSAQLTAWVTGKAPPGNVVNFAG